MKKGEDKQWHQTDLETEKEGVETLSQVQKSPTTNREVDQAGFPLSPRVLFEDEGSEVKKIEIR